MSSGFLVDKMPSIIHEIGNHSWNVRLREKKSARKSYMDYTARIYSFIYIVSMII